MKFLESKLHYILLLIIVTLGINYVDSSNTFSDRMEANTFRQITAINNTRTTPVPTITSSPTTTPIPGNGQNYRMKAGDTITFNNTLSLKLDSFRQNSSIMRFFQGGGVLINANFIVNPSCASTNSNCRTTKFSLNTSDAIKELQNVTIQLQAINGDERNGFTASIRIVAKQQVPKISEVTPRSASIGDEVSLEGTSFSTDSQNTLFIDGNAFATQVDSLDGTSLTFTIPDKVKMIPPCTNRSQCSRTPVLTAISPGRHRITVSNTIGTSNPVILTIEAAE
jgi:hypothetical protein